MSNTYNALIHAKQDGTGEEVANNKTGGDGSLYAPVTSIATPENGDSASKAYAVGEMFIRGDKLCTCIVAISSGDTLVKDTNYKEGSVGEVLTELNSKTTYTSANATITPAMSGRFKLYKKNKTVTAEIRFSTDSSYIPTVGQKIGTIPTGYAPTTSVIFELIHAGDNALSKIELKSDGGIYSLSTGIDFQNWMTGQVTYYVG